MNPYYLQIATGLTVSLVLSLLLIPRIIAISLKFNLVDKPNARKVHVHAISRLGGIAIFFSAFAGIVISRIGLDAVRFWPVLFSSITLVFLLGGWDELTALNAKL